MLNIGMTELLLFGIIALLVLGPEKLPEALRAAGKWYSKFKRLLNNVQHDIDRELRLSEMREQMQIEMQRIQALEAKMQAQMAAAKMQNLTQKAQVRTAHPPTPQALQQNYVGLQPIAQLPPIYQAQHWLQQQQLATFSSYKVAV